MGDAVQASHQPDILYLHALHFASVPLKNTTRLGGGREERGSVRNNTSLSTLLRRPFPKEHVPCVLGSRLFLIPHFFGADCAIACWQQGFPFEAVTSTLWKLSGPHLTLVEIQWHRALEIIDNNFFGADAVVCEHMTGWNVSQVIVWGIKDR